MLGDFVAPRLQRAIGCSLDCYPSDGVARETQMTVVEPKSLVANLKMTAAKQIVAKQKKSPKAKDQKTPNVQTRVIGSLRVAKKQKLVQAVVAWLQTNVDVFGTHPRAM